MIDLGIYNIVSESGDRLRQILRELDQAKKTIQTELDYREADGNRYKYGFSRNGYYVQFDSYSQAVDAIVEQTKDPDAGYRIQKVYY